MCWLRGINSYLATMTSSTIGPGLPVRAEVTLHRTLGDDVGSSRSKATIETGYEHIRRRQSLRS